MLHVHLNLPVEKRQRKSWRKIGERVGSIVENRGQRTEKRTDVFYAHFVGRLSLLYCNSQKVG